MKIGLTTFLHFYFTFDNHSILRDISHAEWGAFTLKKYD